MSRVEFGSTPVLEPPNVYQYLENQKIHRFDVTWTSKSFGIICDLDLTIYCYDERARFIEKLDAGSKRTADQSCVLVSDQDSANSQGNTFAESVKVDFRLVDKETSAILLYLDGGPRNFQFVQQITTECCPLTSRAVIPGQQAPQSLFQFSCKSQRDYQGVGLCVLYKDTVIVTESTAIEGASEGEGEGEEKKESSGTSDKNKSETTKIRWVCKPILEPVYTSSQKGKEAKCLNIVVNNVPSLEKFRPRLFANVNDVCAALSSESLPGLKKQFTAYTGGLKIGKFTEVIFRQLYKKFPKIIESSECAYTVAMIQEMFQQIDYNGDGGADWEEFTTFCIQTASEGKSNLPQGSSMDEYVIEYAEDTSKRDVVLSPYKPVNLMKFISDNGIRKFLVIPDSADRILFLDEKFKLRSEITPYNVAIKSVLGTKANSNDKDMQKKDEHLVRIFDVIFLTGRDLYAFSASDHSITICREQGGVGNRKATHVLYNRLYHGLLHLKLCWSESQSILCSVADNRVIYGWDIDKPLPIFQVSRHSDIVTDFICCDSLDMFITCAMDKKIVMWSSITRRVKGILMGHRRGLRCLSAFENYLLSAGFESDARTWDLSTKENIGILKGHRFPIAHAKLMCDGAQTERDYRAITVDESGEFRLWNVFVKERTSSAVLLPTLQTFEMNNPAPPLMYVKFIALPHNMNQSTSYYSNLVAVGTKMMTFIPEKNTKEFVPPSCSVFNSAAAELITCVGKSLLKYDVCKGVFGESLNDIHNADLSAVCLDGPRGRRMFIGCGNGDVLLVNYQSGQIIDSINVHKKEINCIYSSQGFRNYVYTASADGGLGIIEEAHGDLHLHNCLEKIFGENVGVTGIGVAESIQTVVCISTKKIWGIWNASTGKKMAIFEEEFSASSVEVIGSSKDEDDIAYLFKNEKKMDKSAINKREKEKLLTIALAFPLGIKVYTFDVAELRGICSFSLSHLRPPSDVITSLMLLRYPEGESVNYAGNLAVSKEALGLDLVATTDEGYIVVWNMENLRWESEDKFRGVFPKAKSKKKVHSGSNNNNNNNNNKQGDKAFMTTGDNDGRPGTAETATSHNTNEEGNSNKTDRPGTADTADTGPNDDNKDTQSLGSLSLGFVNEIVASQFFLSLHATEKLGEERAQMSTWQAHKDSISVCAPMHEHSCFMTGSHDGFHRVWNLNETCLGEMQLPNLTEKMKNPKDPILEKTAWKFILERIAITSSHHAIAAKLTIMVKEREDAKDHRKKRSQQRGGLALAGANLKTLQSAIDDIEVANHQFTKNTEQDKLRTKMLSSMNEKIGPRLDAAPNVLPTKDELKLAELNAKLHTHGTSGKHSNPHTSGGDEGGEDGIHSPKVLGASHSSMPPDLHSTKSMASDSTFITGDIITEEESNVPTTPLISPIKKNVAHFGMNTRQALWSIASENLKGNASATVVPNAFSEESLARSNAEGTIDEESHTILRGFSVDKSKVSQYTDTNKGVILLRSPSLSTSIELPHLENMRRAEVSFGNQKDYYKNAEMVLNDRDNIKKDKMREAITLARIDVNVRKLGSMIHLIDPIQVDEVAIPHDNPAKEFQEKTAKEMRKMQIRLMQSSNLLEKEIPEIFDDIEGEDGELREKKERKPLNKSKISDILKKVNEAADPKYHDKWDKLYSMSRGKSKKQGNLPVEAKEELEKKIRAAIRDAYAEYAKVEAKQKEEEEKKLMNMGIMSFDSADKDKDDDDFDENESPKIERKKSLIPIREQEKKGGVTLETRLLLPYYKAENVRRFMDIFTKVDEDFSGDLDMNEWVKLFTGMNNSVPVQEARSIFMKFKNEHGVLTVNELVPVVFSKASKEQVKYIIKFCLSEIMKSAKEITTMKFTEVDQLFEMYDHDNIGFVSVGVIREKIRGLGLNDVIAAFFLKEIKDIDDDEMVNHREFGRIWKPYVSRSELLAHEEEERRQDKAAGPRRKK